MPLVPVTESAVGVDTMPPWLSTYVTDARSAPTPFTVLYSRLPLLWRKARPSPTPPALLPCAATYFLPTTISHGEESENS